MIGSLQTSGAVDRQAMAGVDLSAYTLPDGTLPVICFGNGAPDETHVAHCDECTTPVAFLLSGNLSSGLIADLLVSASLFVSTHLAATSDNANCNTARAPPLFS